MVKNIITEISEEDFRKLDIRVYAHEWITDGDSRRLKYIEKKANDLLDRDIAIILEEGTDSGQRELDIPVTFAIHEDNFGDNPDYDGLHGYFDKFMNAYTGITTFYIAWGIKHLYSSRDYFYDKEDYWRVRKDETKVIYRIKLDKKWKEKFVLKKYTAVEPYNGPLPANAIHANVNVHYERARAGEEFHETFRHLVVQYDGHATYTQVDKNNEPVMPDLEVPDNGRN